MTVIALDNRGVGKSSRPNTPFTIDTFVEDIKELLEYLNVQEPIHLCGFSMGGWIALLFVLKYPHLVKTLILCGTNANLDPQRHEQDLKSQEELIKNAPLEEIIQIMIPVCFSTSFRKKLKTDKELFDLIKSDMGLIAYLNDPPRYQDYVNQLIACEGYDVRELIHKIKQPTLIMVGSKDQLEPQLKSEFLHQKIPNSTLEVFDKLGHGFFIENPEKTNNVMWNFLKEYLQAK